MGIVGVGGGDEFTEDQGDALSGESLEEGYGRFPRGEGVLELFAFSLACAFALLASSLASAAIVEHTFRIENTTIKRFCKEQVIVTVNGSFPGPTINVREGDTVIVHVINQGPYDITIHWHGVFQLFSIWADGPEYVTQCPIAPKRDLYSSNVEDITAEAQATGGGPNTSYAFIINGLTSDLLNCTEDERYDTDIIVIAPGQSADVLFTVNQTIGSYYMVASPYVVNFDAFNRNIARGTVIYDNAAPSSKPTMPILPPANDTETAFKFYSNVTSKVGARHWVPVPLKVDEHMLVTIGFGLELCDSNNTCAGQFRQRYSASMNNESFAIPPGIKMSMLEAFYNNVSGVYTKDFPDKPPLKFDFTNLDNANNMSLLFAPKSTKAKKLNFNSTVEIVFQNTALLLGQNHPMHLHGYDFHVLAQGFGNFNDTDRAKFNLVNPQLLAADEQQRKWNSAAMMLMSGR
ncbi:hypothetical protein V8G54_009546 [Vigna mungo]|uniref:Laccase n=1 Tax=Vigna mungo TaxID=3915 RepID=A0AAQ3S5K7_VIGMU